MFKPSIVLIIVVGFFVPMASPSVARPADPQASRVYSLIDRLITKRSVVGAQVAVGTSGSPLMIRSFGVRDIRHDKPVNPDTRFCIGSCSKMFAAAVLVSLASENTVELDSSIDRWLKGFATPKLANGTNASRAPTLRELLCHRAGVYSQRNQMTKRQTRWIRNFRLSLAESVTGMTTEPLGAEPGQEFAYSGAGYCILGRVAEVATGKPFDELLASRVNRPLQLLRTTYFPPVNDDNVAVGHALQGGKLSVVKQTPHLLGKKHKFALIGGSIYAPARESAEFARMLLHKGMRKDRKVLSLAEWKQMTVLHSPRPSGGYGLGLVVTVDPKTRNVQSVSHSGSLFGSFSHIAVNFRTRRFGAVNFTGSRNREISVKLQEWVNSTVIVQ